MSKNWELDDVKRLIVEHKKRPVLWQLNHPAYGKKGPRAKAMKELIEIVWQTRKHDTQSHRVKMCFQQSHALLHCRGGCFFFRNLHY